MRSGGLHEFVEDAAVGGHRAQHLNEDLASLSHHHRSARVRPVDALLQSNIVPSRSGRDNPTALVGQTLGVIGSWWVLPAGLLGALLLTWIALVVVLVV